MVTKTILLFVISILLPLVLFRFNKILIRELIRDLRWIRILHFMVMGVLGCVLYLKMSPQSFNIHIVLLFLIFFIALIYAAVFAIVTNNIEDIEADKITNPRRPLVAGSVNPTSYFLAGIICLLFALIISLIMRLEMFFGILAISAGYYIYSCKPFRLKRIPFVSKLIIGINTFSVTVCGFVLAGGTLTEFPVIWAVFILVPLSLAANFIDLKDTEGDRVAGIKTLPVIFGERKAKIFIAICTIATYVMAGLLLNINWAYPLNAIALVFHLWFLFRKPYNEKAVFLIYISSLIALNVLLLL
jgi:4-hydroxybenzoate polyprenyltransferase